jgi:hypothetical protein
MSNPRDENEERRRPLQPLVKDSSGIVRFQPNEIVCTLVDECRARGFSLNELFARDFRQADREQFFQLIGYSIAGYHELSDVSDDAAREATVAARRVDPDARGCRDDGCPTHCGIERRP